MFKLPLLQPHLTGSNGVDGKAGSLSKYSPFLASSKSQKDAGSLGGEVSSSTTTSSGNAYGLEIKDWEAQAKDITADVTSSDKYKSLALHAEVKLAEALERCTRLCPSAYTAQGEERPAKLKTAVCCQLLGEFAEMCGPFSLVLRNIRDELVRSVYSDTYSSERGNLSFDQLPWFTVCERLEAEKEVMLEERERFTEMLHEQQEVIARIEQQMSSYQRATQAAQLEAAQVRSRLESLVTSEELARVEARTGREELKRVRKEWLRLKDDLEAERDAHRKLKEQSDQDSGASKAQVSLLSDALSQAQAELSEAQVALATRLPVEAVSGLQSQLKQLTAAAAESKRKIEMLENAAQENEVRLGTMTPRPTFRAMRKFGVEEGAGRRTQDLITAAAEKLTAFVTAAQLSAGRAADLELLLVDDPRPAEVTLAIATDASAYFITEGGDDPAAPPGSTTVSAEGLGRGPHVPRCLRRRAGTMVTGLPVLSLEATEALCAHIWKAKQVHDTLHPAQHLQAFLYTYFSQQLFPSVSSGAGKPTSPTLTTAPPGALHHAITQHAYSLYHSLATHSRASPTVRLFRSVLTGQLPEAVHTQCTQLFSSLLAVANGTTAAMAAATDDGRPPTPALVPTAVMLDALHRLCASLPSYKATRLKEVYSQSVGPVSVPLEQLEALLVPLSGCYDAAAVRAAVQGSILSVAESQKAEEVDEDREGIEGLRRMSSRSAITAVQLDVGLSVGDQGAGDLAPAELHVAPPDQSACLGNGFVSMLLQLFLEHHEAVAAAVTREVEGLAVASDTSSGTSSARARSATSASDDGVTPLTPLEKDVLGGQVSPATLLVALQGAGMPPEQATTEMLGVIGGCGVGLGIWLTARDALCVMSACKPRVWSGQCLIKLLSDACMLRAAPGTFPDITGMLA